MKKMKKWTIAAAGLVCAAISSSATTFNSDGTDCCGPNSVQAIHDAQATRDGDTITIPAGTFDWTVGLSLTKGVTLQGQGVGVTIIKDSAPANLILWDLRNTSNNAARLTGVEIQAGSTASNLYRIQTRSTNTNGSTFRWDHSKWNNARGVALSPDTTFGVCDHVDFFAPNYVDMVRPYATYWNGGDFGDGSWASPANWGSGDFFFVEDCTFHWPTGTLGPVTDSSNGARFVVRYNDIYDGMIQSHGTESSGRLRGTRAIEAYGNRFHGTGINRFLGMGRFGSAVIHDNTATGYWGDSACFAGSNYRAIETFAAFGGADGTNPWDRNDITGGPNGNGIYFSGTAAANSSGQTVTLSGASWTPNQWASGGYVLRRKSNICGVNTISFAGIVSNTANTITYSGAIHSSPLSFCPGDTLEIRRVILIMDQIGAGEGSLVSSILPVAPAGWNNEIIEPVYCWGNTNELGHAINFQPAPSQNQIAGVHIINGIVKPGYTPFTYPHPLTVD